MKSLPLLAIIISLMAVQASAADVFERYLAVIGLREQHNGLLLAGFDTARMLSQAKNGSEAGSLDTEANRKRVKEIVIEELGFDAVRSDYLREVRQLFTEQELVAAIDYLEKPAVAGVLRRQAEAFADILVKTQLKAGPRMDNAKKRISREVLGR